jgi:hypothetical protein
VTAWGAKTEIDKLREGHCRWYFTGYSDGADGLMAWWILDMDVVRLSGVLVPPLWDQWPAHLNDDGSGGVYVPMHELLARGCVVFSGNEVSRALAARELEVRP